MVFHAGSKNRIMDFDLRLTAQAELVTLDDTKEGTFALRVATPMEESRESAQGVRRTGMILSAEGRVGEQQVWGTRSPWVDYSGVIEGCESALPFSIIPKIRGILRIGKFEAMVYSPRTSSDCTTSCPTHHSMEASDSGAMTRCGSATGL